MPIYEYRCDTCKERFERLLSLRDPDPDKCPKCKDGKPKKIVSRSSFLLKGTGWYRDGYGG